METKVLALAGKIFTHKKEKNILTSIDPKDVMQVNYPIIASDQHLADLVELIKQSDRNIFVVIDNRQRFAGIIELNDIKQKLFNPASFNKITVGSLMKKPAATIDEKESMHSIMEKFDLTNSWHLPVLDNNKKFKGFISKSQLFSKYRDLLSRQSDLYE